MRVAITGSSGLVGKELVDHFLRKEAEVICFVRDRNGLESNALPAFWNPSERRIDVDALEKCDVVIHLAGAGIADKRWSESRKRIILESRTLGTSLLADTLAKLKHPPKVLLSASAIGFYGNHDRQTTVNEQTKPDDSFLSRVCQAWERETRTAQEVGIRVLHMRFGVVLAAHGGALARMLPLFEKGLGGRLGNGRQIMSWIALPEIPRIVDYLIETESMAGAVNVVSPEAVSNSEFTSRLATCLGRLAILPVPALAMKLALGEMAEALLLGGARVLPEKLLKRGYEFQYPHLEDALKIVLQCS